MRKGRDLIGLPIISLQEGKQIGEVVDIIFDPRKNKILALVTEEKGWFRGAKIVPFNKINNIGEDAVTVKHIDVQVYATDQPEINRFSDEEVNIIKSNIITESGNSLGMIEDILIDIEGGHIEGYEISGGIVRDIIDGRIVIPLPDSITIGKDVVIVPDWVEEEIRQSEGGLRAAFSDLRQDAIKQWKHLSEEFDSVAEELKEYGQDLTAKMEKEGEAFVLGKRVDQSIVDDKGKTIIHSGEIVTDEVIKHAKNNGKMQELAYAVGVVRAKEELKKYRIENKDKEILGSKGQISGEKFKISKVLESSRDSKQRDREKPIPNEYTNITKKGV